MTLLSLLLPVLAAFQPAARDANLGPKLDIKLHAAQATVPPGGATELAIEIDVDKGWHMYHAVTLDAGVGTTVRFEAPPGLTFGPLDFPAPELVSEQDLEYLGLAGRFVVLTRVQVAPDAPPGARKIRALVSGLACKELCVLVDRTAELTLNVGAAPSGPAASAPALFTKARAEMPAPLDKAEYIEGSSVGTSPGTLKPGESADILLKLRVKPGHHLWDRDPGAENLIPTRLIIESLDGLKLAEQQWPAPKLKSVAPYGRVREHSGELTIRVPVSIVDDRFPSAPVALRVLVNYQVCTDAGQCFPPRWAEAVVRFVAETPNPPPAEGMQLGTLMPAVTVNAALAGPAAGTGSGGASRAPTSLYWQLVLAFLGGMLLNVMPCVFPVISLKIIGFVQQAGEDRGRVLRLGLTFCAGIMVWFWIFGILTGQGHVALQYAPVTIGLTALMFVFALNLFGVFELTLGGAEDRLGALARREGYSGAFLKGLLATLLGTACTAPLFASAAAWATTQPPPVSFLIFTTAGLGMALPYALLSAYPDWLRKLPRPGPWMVTFKQAMGFVLLATAVWLLTIVADQLDARGVVWTVAFLGFLGLAAWLIGKVKLNWEAPARLITWVFALAIVLFGGWFSFSAMYDLRTALAPGGAQTAAVADGASADEIVAAVQASSWNDHIPWQPWRPGLPEELARRGHAVYVDFTATWCVTCQTNKAIAVEIDSTRTKMKALGVIPLKADYTRRDPVIRNQLLAFGHNSVPLNLVYPAGRPDNPIQLPIILTPGAVAEALDQAAPSSSPAVAGKGE